MRRPSRFRRIAKWAGIGMCTVIVIVWALSGWSNVHYVSRSGILLGVESGRLWCAKLSPYLAFRFFSYEEPPKFIVRPSPVPKPYWNWTAQFASSGKNSFAMLPCWILLSMAVVPTGALIWRDHRRIPPGHCKKCGYDLTGNTSGRCPECGKGVA